MKQLGHTLSSVTGSTDTTNDPAANCLRTHLLIASTDSVLQWKIPNEIEHSTLISGVTYVEGFLMAMGHLASGRNHGNRLIVLGHIKDLVDGPEPTATALRRLAPEALLVLVVAHQLKADATRIVQAGFDHILDEPIDPQHLLFLITTDQGHHPINTTHDSVTQPTNSELKTDAIIAKALHEGVGPSPSRDLKQDVLNDPQGDQLGDIDLIDSILLSKQKLRRLAMKMLADHSKIKHIALAESSDQLPLRHSYVLVRHRDQEYGVLHAPLPATVANLEPWADWLARWLALEGRMHQLRDWALHDELTGVWHRRYLNSYLDTLVNRAKSQRFCITVLLFDIDDFKQYNDRYGHAAGDEILREAARLITSVVRDHDVVARIGGDEFVVVFWDAEGPRRPNSQHPATVRTATTRFQRAICQHKFPKLAEEAPGTLTISGGLASFPWDGQTPQALIAKADEMALQSKQQGKNVITVGPGVQKTCEVLFPQ